MAILRNNRPLLIELFPSVYIPGFLMYAAYGMTAAITPLYATSLGGALALAGVVVSMRGLGQLVMNVPSGLIMGRFGNRKLLLISTFCAIAIALFTGLSNSISLLAICMFLAGSVQSTWSITRVSHVRSIVPPEFRGRAISAIGGAVRIGGFVGPIVGGYIAKFFGFSTVFFVQAGIIGIAAIFYLIPSPEFADTPVESTEKPLAQVGSILRTHYKSFLTVGLVAIAFSVLRSARATVFPLWGDAIAIDVAKIGLIVGLSSGVDMLLFIPVGIINDRFGRKWTAVPSLVIMSLALFLLPLTGSFGALLSVGLAIGFGNGFGSGIVMTLGTDLAPNEGTGPFLGVWFLVSGIGFTLGPLVIGGVAEVLSLGAASVITAIIGCLGAAFLLFFVRETRPDGNN
jgi:MFS family permease